MNRCRGVKPLHMQPKIGLLIDPHLLLAQSLARKDLRCRCVNLHTWMIHQGIALSLRQICPNRRNRHKLPLDIGLDLQRTLAIRGRLGQRFKHGLAPGNMGLSKCRQLAQQPHGERIGQRIGGIGVVDVRTHQMRLKHAVDGNQALDRGLELPHMFAQPSEVVGGGLLTVTVGAQLFKPLTQEVGRLHMIVDVIAKDGLERKLRRGMGPAADHLHQLDFQITVVR